MGFSILYYYSIHLNSIYNTNKSMRVVEDAIAIGNLRNFT